MHAIAIPAQIARMIKIGLEELACQEVSASNEFLKTGISAKFLC